VQREIQRGATEVTRAAQEQRRTLLEEKDAPVDPAPTDKPEGPAQ
jgi:hypothetical protein